MISFGGVPASSVLPVFFDTFAAATGAPITMTNFAVGDVLIYKGTSMTQRSSTAGVVLLDTDGVDLDSITGIQGFSIDLSDNTDAGFYAAGSFYNVVVSTVTVDGQTLSFVACTFRILAAENTAGYPVIDAAKWNNLATVALPLIPTTAGRTLDVSATGEAGVDWANVGSPTTILALTGTTIAVTQKVDVDTIKTNPVVNGGTVTFTTNSTVASTTNITAGTITTATNLTNAPTAGDFTATMKTSIGTAVAASAVASVTGNVGGNVAGSVASVTAAVAITSNIKKNQALAGFEFLMTDSTNHAPATGLTVAVTRSIDGGAFAAGTLSAVTEISDGVYSVDFGAGDLNGKVITLKATEATSDTTFERIVTQA